MPIVPPSANRVLRSGTIFNYDPNIGTSLQQQLGQFYGFGRPVAPGIGAGGFPIAPGTTGALPGLPGYGGSPAAGRIPQVSNPTGTAAAAISGNVANMPGLSTLFNQVGSTYVPGFQGLQSTEAQNIANLLGGQYNTPEAFRRTAELGSAGGLAGSDAAQTAEILWHRRFEDKARREGANRLSQAVARGRGVLDLAGFQVTPREQQEAQQAANLYGILPDPELSYLRARNDALAGIGRGFGAGFGPGGGGGTTLSGSASPAASIAQRYSGSGGGMQPNPGTSPPGASSTGGYGYLRPSDGGPGYGVYSGGLPFTLPDTRPFFGPGGPPDYSSANMPRGGWYSDMPYGGYESPGDVPYWWKGDPEDLVNPYL